MINPEEAQRIIDKCESEYKGWSERVGLDHGDEGTCTGCQHITESNSDLFGCSYICEKGHNTDDHLYDTDECGPCEGFQKCLYSGILPSAYKLIFKKKGEEDE